MESGFVTFYPSPPRVNSSEDTIFLSIVSKNIPASLHVSVTSEVLCPGTWPVPT